MRLIFQIISWLSLVVLTAPALLYLSGKIQLDDVKKLMLAASCIWFISASLWMWKEKPKT